MAKPPRTGNGLDVARSTLDSSCPRCRYDLTGSLAAHRWSCPECGYNFTLDELRSITENPSLRPGPKALVRSAAGQLGAMFAVGAICVVVVVLYLAIAFFLILVLDS